MKLVPKMTAALLIATCAVLAGYGYLTVQRETHMLQAAVLDDARATAHLIRDSFVNEWRDSGRESAMELIADPVRGGRMAFDVVPVTPARLEFYGLDAVEIHRVMSGEEVSRITPGTPSVLHVFLPLEDLPLHSPRALVLNESLAFEEGYVSQTKRRIGLTTLALVVICGALAFLIGSRIVGRPMRELMHKADRVGRGDLSGPLELRQHDEIGELAQHMNQMCEDLARESAQRVEALEQLRHSERLATVGRLASGIAHELGTPLNVVLGRALMIQRSDAASEGLSGDAQIIVQQAERMSGIIRQLLDFARRGNTRASLQDVREVLRRMQLLLGSLAKEEGIAFSASIPERPQMALIDAAQIEQALTNMVMNAVQASSEGDEVKLSLEPCAAHPPGSDELGPYLKLTVSDTGPGIPREAQLRVFEPFFTTKEVGKGTGLGLPVAHGIVQNHGGWIELDSAPGEGCRFTIYLPAAEEAA